MAETPKPAAPQEQFVRNPITGRAVKATTEQAAALAALGGTALSQKQFQEAGKATENLEYVEQMPMAAQAAAGIGSGLTLGLGPAALAHMGIVDPGKLSALETSGPFQAGDVAGMVAPAILSGGEAVGARGVIARAMAGSPAGLLNAGGGLAERLAGRLLPEVGAMGKLARPTLQMAARGATEGSLINMAHTVSDSVIHDHPLTWSAIAASGADGALLGGLLGGGLGGITALGGQAVDAIGGAAVRTAGSHMGSDGAVTALKRAGAGQGELEKFAAGKLGIEGTAAALDDILTKGGESFASRTPAMVKVLKQAEKDFAVSEAGQLATLDREAASLTPSLEKVQARIQNDLNVKWQGTTAQNDVQRVLGGLNKDMAALESRVAKGEFAGQQPVSKYGDHPSVYNEAMEQFNSAKAAHAAVPDLLPGPGASWTQWAKSREHLSDLVAKARGGINEDVYRTALNSFDTEIRQAMELAGDSIGQKGISDAYHAAVMGKKFSGEMHGMVTGKAVSEMGFAQGLGITGMDVGTASYGTLMGHPVGAMGIIAGKKLMAHAQKRLEPVLAEAAYRASLGAKAQAATVNIGNRVSASLRKFMMGGTKTASYETAKKPNINYTKKGYEDTVAATRKLTDAAHGQKVQEMSEQLRTMGHPILADQAMEQYMRATQYINYALPPSSAVKQAGKLGKMPTQVGLGTKEMKALRIISAIRNPVDTMLAGLETGNLSREAVNAIKYVYLPLHQDIVMRTAQAIMEVKQAGKFMPADKVTTLGVFLDAAVDSTLEKSYVAEIQKAHIANNKPDQANGQTASPGGMPLAQVNDYKTPLQTSAT